MGHSHCLCAFSLVRRGSFLSNFVSVQVEELFHVLARARGKGPILGVVVGIDDGEHDTAAYGPRRAMAGWCRRRSRR